MQAILLAGGPGTRFRSVVNDWPKSMALIEGRPFMEYAACELARHGVTGTVSIARCKGTMVEKYFGDRAAFGFHADYAYEETLLDTTGAIKNAGRSIIEDRFYTSNGDTFYQVDHTWLPGQQDSQNLDMALVLYSVPDISWYGRAVLGRDGSLIGFNEKTEDAGRGMINGGTYLMEQRLLSEVPEGKVSLENNMIPR